METAVDDLWSLDNDALLDSFRDEEILIRQLQFRQLRIIREIEARGLAESHGCPSTANLLRDLAELSMREATARVKAAAALLGEVSVSGEPTEPVAPRTAEAAAEGAIGPEQIRVITTTLDKIPVDARTEA